MPICILYCLWEFYFVPYSLIFLKTLFIYLFREKGKEGEREGEKHQCVIAPHVSPTGDLARNPGMCPDWESNQQPFGSQARTQSTELYQPGPYFLFFFLSGILCGNWFQYIVLVNFTCN